MKSAEYTYPICTSCDCYPCACGRREYRERPELVASEAVGSRERIKELTERAERAEKQLAICRAVLTTLQDKLLRTKALMSGPYEDLLFKKELEIIAEALNA